MKAADYLEAFVERYKGHNIKLVLVGGRILQGTLSSSKQWDKDIDRAYVITNPKTLVLFNVSQVVYIHNKKRIRKKRSG